MGNFNEKMLKSDDETKKKILKELNRKVKETEKKLMKEIVKQNRFSDIPEIPVPMDIMSGSFKKPYEIDDDDDDDYMENIYGSSISFVELAIINSYLYDNFRTKKDNDITVSSYGTVDNIGRLEFGGVFENTKSFWFKCTVKEDENDYFIQTKIYVDSRGELICEMNITSFKSKKYSDFKTLFQKIKKDSFNNSEYKGKCIKVKLIENSFRGIEIIDIKDKANELILNETQFKFINHFISRVGRGGNARYLLNGEPGTGKTETIREICRSLMPNVTFVIPDFYTIDDFNMIMEASETFDSAVIIMDDIDLFLGSRENGSYTRLLGQFLSFFDGVKKRKISLLASTNDKGLVDKAAERPGRFNFTLDYTFLDEDQIVKVCNIHLPEKWQIKEVYEALTGRINGKKVNITGAFIANLADNIREMSEDEENWDIEDTISLIKESYKGFYMSQTKKEEQSMGFKI